MDNVDSLDLFENDDTMLQHCVDEDEEEDGYDYPEQQCMFEDIPPDWVNEWKGMPEFVMDELGPWKTIYLHFANKEDMKKFSLLIEQTVTLDTKGIWYPKQNIERFLNKRYVDEPDVSSVHNIEGKMATEGNKQNT